MVCVMVCRGAGAGQESEGPALKKAINILGTILTFNFVIIISFFLWFATGMPMPASHCPMHYSSQSSAHNAHTLPVAPSWHSLLWNCVRLGQVAC